MLSLTECAGQRCQHALHVNRRLPDVALEQLVNVEARSIALLRSTPSLTTKNSQVVDRPDRLIASLSRSMSRSAYADNCAWSARKNGNMSKLLQLLHAIASPRRQHDSVVFVIADASTSQQALESLTRQRSVVLQFFQLIHPLVGKDALVFLDTVRCQVLRVAEAGSYEVYSVQKT